MRVWTPPPKVIARGEGPAPRYTGFSTIRPGEPSQLGERPAVTAFRDYVVRRFRKVSSGGIRRSPPKDATPGRHRDPHEDYRAVDAMVSEFEVGDEVANWLVTWADVIGVQYVLWCRYEWSASPYGSRWEPYTGTNPHTDHVHIELSEEAASLSADAMRARLAGIERLERWGWTVPAGAAVLALVGAWLLEGRE